MTSILDQITDDLPQLRFELNSIPYTLNRIPPGDFYLGSPPDEEGHESHEGPVRRVRITRTFYLGVYPITRAQHRCLTGERRDPTDKDEWAADQLSRKHALGLCEQLSARLNVPVTLPTEAQWEYACRAGTAGSSYASDQGLQLDDIAWYRENSNARVHAVGHKRPNKFGLHDMLGNLWEHCIDLLPDYTSIATSDPEGPHGEEGALRGGAWMNPAVSCRSAARMISNDMFGGTGLRIAINR